MSKVFIQYANASAVKIVAQFSCQQDPIAYANQDQIDDTDARYKVFIDPRLSLSGMATAMTVAVQDHMDTRAQAHGYDSLLSAISYADEPAVPSFRADGLAFRAWRSLVWAKCHEVLAKVQAGTLAVPTEAALLAMLPEVAL